MKNFLQNIALVFVFYFCGNSFIWGQSDREWWNSLSPGWKKVFQKQELKGKDIEPSDELLSRIVSVKQIDCSHNKDINDLKPLSKLILLEKIRCNNSSNIKSLEGIENLINLKELNCSSNDNISSLIPLTSLVNLEKLNCSNTMTKDLRPLRGLTKLRVLDVHLCTINDLSILYTMTSLERLNVAQNISLFSLSGVEKLVNLVELNCSETKVDDLSYLERMKNLEIVDFSKTPVKTLRYLQTVRSLKEINCSDTEILGSSLSYLYSHVNLRMFKCKGNYICQTDSDEFTAMMKKVSAECILVVEVKTGIECENK